MVRQVQADGGEWRFAYMLSGAAVTGPGCPGPTCPGVESFGRIQQGYTFSGGFVVATTVTDPRGNSTTYRFNNFSYPIEQIDALGQSTKFERGNGTNLLLSATDPLGHTTQFTYDAQGNLTQVTNPLGHATQIAYNGVGQPVSITDALGNVTQFAYTSQGDLATSTDPLGNSVTRTYDVVSRLVQQTDPRGKATTFAYDALNRLVKVVDPVGAVTAFSFDPNGNLLSVTDPRGGTITYEYDSMDRLQNRTDPIGQPETYGYDLAGSVTNVQDRKNQTTAISYDALGRRSVTTYADGSTVTATYDAGGRLTSLADSVAGTISWTYDVLDRVLSETTPQGTVSYAYDAAGRRTSMTVAGQSPVSYTYDNANRLLTIAKDALTATYAYDDANRRTALTLPKGVTTQYTYDSASRLTALTYSGLQAGPQSLTYTYDPSGNRVRTGGSWARTLLPAAVSGGTYDAANRQLTLGAKSMTYDFNGNLATLTESGQTTTYTWDPRDRLIGVTGPGLTALFSYDATDRRTSKTITGFATTFLYDGLDITKEIAGGATVNYLRGLGIDEHLARIEDSGDTLCYTPDALGSTLALTDSAGSTPTEYTFEPFGRTVANGAASQNAFQFTGRENDAPNLYHYRARYYGPSESRFSKEDPIGLVSGTNFYSYVGNNPVNLVDPLGLQYAPSIPGNPGIPFPPPQFWPGTRENQEWVDSFCQLLEAIKEGLQKLQSRGRRDRWYCRVKCYVIVFDPPGNASWVFGDGYGPTEEKAYEAAEKEARQKTPRGSRTKHCRKVFCDKR